MNGKDEKMITEELKRIKKTGTQVSPELTTRLRYLITSIDGDSEPSTINNFVQNMLSKDSLALRKEVSRVAPDVDMEQEIEVEGESVTVFIPMTVSFFWPNA